MGGLLVAIEFLDMTPPKVKFMEDGMLNEQRAFLGDNFDLVKWTRGIPERKQNNFLDVLRDNLLQTQWHRKTLESVLEFLESAKGNVPSNGTCYPCSASSIRKMQSTPVTGHRNISLHHRKTNVASNNAL
jgi:hypothetical protein